MRLAGEPTRPRCRFLRALRILRQRPQVSAARAGISSAPKIEQIANELHVSARTLQRQLNELGSSFKKIVEVERMKRCDQLLQQDMQLTDIAMQLGYSDQSALARAYKAFSGQTLLQRKQQLKASPEL